MSRDQRQIVQNVLRASAFHMRCLEAVRELSLSDWAIGAGFVRNAVWDHLHGFSKLTPLSDIDVLYFDPFDISRQVEAAHEKQLSEMIPGLPWEVRNQARMHVAKGEQPHRSTEDALCFWLETPTCVAVRLEEDDALTLLAPYGLDDLLNLKGRPTPVGERKFVEYQVRMRKKNWPSIWKHVQVQMTLD